MVAKLERLPSGFCDKTCATKELLEDHCPNELVKAIRQRYDGCDDLLAKTRDILGSDAECGLAVLAILNLEKRTLDVVTRRRSNA